MMPPLDEMIAAVDWENQKYKAPRPKRPPKQSIDPELDRRAARIMDRLGLSTRPSIRGLKP
ncbi:MAG: hypothetical protein ABJN40_13340 [Sneathiella sp.]